MNRVSDKHLIQVQDALLAQHQLTPAYLEQLLSQFAQRKIDYADIYVQTIESEFWQLEERLIKNGNYHIDQGAGVRAITGEKSGFAYADQLTPNALQRSVIMAQSIAPIGGTSPVRIQTTQMISRYYPALNPLAELTNAEKCEYLKQLDQFTRAQDPRVIDVQVNLSGSYEMVLIAATDGTLAADIRPLVRLSINVLVEGTDGRREHGSSGGGGRTSYQQFFVKASDLTLAETYASEAVRIALINLSARAAPAGNFPVVLGAGWPGVLLHEAVGHGLEADFARKGSSVFSQRLGEQVASPLCTVIDDGTLPGKRGSLSIDDEGVPTQRNVLIEHGILRNYMQDKLNARLLGMAPTGNARRQSYAHLPMPRMTNTYLLPGKTTQEEMIASVEYGLYAPNFAGGQVDITSGKFVFTMAEAYLIEQGKITHPVKGATLIGSGIEIMQQVSMVGNDWALDPGIGVCGKEGQSVPVGVGQPSVKLTSITVGGSHKIN